MTDVHNNGLKKLSPDRGKCSQKLDPKTSKLDAGAKLKESFKELEESLQKTKEAFGSFQTKCFFYPEPEFNKAFKEYLQQVQSVVTDMGSTLSNLFRSDKLSAGDKEEERKSVAKEEQLSGADDKEEQERKSLAKEELVDTSFSLTTDQSDILAKPNLNITPPASEAGNDDELSTVTQLPEKTFGRKRNVELAPEVVVKKPRRSLIEDYLIRENELKGDTSKAVKEAKADSSSSEEILYEVENIVSYKKSGTNFLYKVSWKGYGMEECTWEPSEHLENCSEVLIEFYKRLIIEREKVPVSAETFSEAFPVDSELQGYLYEAFLIHMNNLSEGDINFSSQQSLLSKTPMTKQEMFEIVDKALHARKVKRYQMMKAIIKDQVILQTVQKERSKQLAQLRSWERSINSVCSDPAKIQVENNVDLELPPFDFVYINELKEGQGVTIPNDPMCGCECTDCYGSQNSCCASQSNSWFAYSKYGRLKVSLGTPIYECNKRCPCPTACPNRVVQKGRTFSLSIFRTDNGRGWGVKTLEPIKKDSFVVEYVGEVITSEEAEHRGQLYDKKGCTYLFDLDFNKGDQNPYTVDAAKYGNVSHFINHSCDPNLVVFNVWVNCLDPDLPRLALFACRDVKKGEELTFDYNSGIGSEQMTAESSSGSAEELSDDEESTTPEKKGPTLGATPNVVLKTPKGNRGLKYGKTECRCGAANCRKYFF
ncbi:histone-lysine N-methyltransferase SUV39H1-like isoform X2 [Macrobrachium rosenbergii]|uniref:histone-lysine N-methyltransferase SUV39H1-like isoform X2 n=1 Tax=Macrobrachium rosenbergii TaxID=79674 RepID=UPI0034D41962